VKGCGRKNRLINRAPVLGVPPAHPKRLGSPILGRSPDFPAPGETNLAWNEWWRLDRGELASSAVSVARPRTHAADLPLAPRGGDGQSGWSFAGPGCDEGSTWAVPGGRIRLLDGVCGAMAADVLGSDDAVFGSDGCGGPAALAHAL
jgi:hypothetical protein